MKVIISLSLLCHCDYQIGGFLVDQVNPGEIIKIIDCHGGGGDIIYAIEFPDFPDGVVYNFKKTMLERFDINNSKEIQDLEIPNDSIMFYHFNGADYNYWRDMQGELLFNKNELRKRIVSRLKWFGRGNFFSYRDFLMMRQLVSPGSLSEEEQSELSHDPLFRSFVSF